jgi:hypothetical protein
MPEVEFCQILDGGKLLLANLENAVAALQRAGAVRSTEIMIAFESPAGHKALTVRAMVTGPILGS